MLTHSFDNSSKNVTADGSASQMLDLIQSQLSFSRNVREPPSFRGEVSDAVDLNEKRGKGKGKWCVAKYGDPYSEFVLCI